MSVITNIEDLRVLAQKRVPRMFYDYADAGSWTESTYRCLLYTSPSPRDLSTSRMPSSA